MCALSTEPETTNASPNGAPEWYVPPKPTVPTGWLVFSEESILRVMQGTFATDKPVRRDFGSLFLLRIVQGFVAVVQALIMLLAMIPLISTLVEAFVVNLPRSSFGFLARAAFWRARLASLGQDTLIERGVTIWGPANVKIGSRSHIDTDVRLAAGEARHGQPGQIEIGDYTHLGPRVHVAGRGGVFIGDFVSLEAGVHVYSATNMMLNPAAPGQLVSISHMAPIDHQHISAGPIQLDDYVTIGFHSIILPHVALGQGVIVHAYTQVNRSFPAYANVVGPGRARQNGLRRALRRDPRLDGQSPTEPAAVVET